MLKIFGAKTPEKAVPTENILQSVGSLGYNKKDASFLTDIIADLIEIYLYADAEVSSAELQEILVYETLESQGNDDLAEYEALPDRLKDFVKKPHAGSDSSIRGEYRRFSKHLYALEKFAKYDERADEAEELISKTLRALYDDNVLDTEISGKIISGRQTMEKIHDSLMSAQSRQSQERKKDNPF